MPVVHRMSGSPAQLDDHWIVEAMIIATRHYIPHLRIIRATSGLHGLPYLESPLEGIIAYDCALTAGERYEAVAEALYLLWRARHLAGRAGADQRRRVPLSAVS